MRKSILSLSVAALVGSAGMLFTACTHVAATVRDFVLAPFSLQPARLTQLHAPSTWVAPVRAFVGRLANRFRPMKTPGWSLCPSA